MKTLFRVIVFLLFVCGCRSNSNVDISNRFITYKLDGNRYAVVYVAVEKTSLSQSRDYALKKAAELTRDSGYRYFKVDSDEEVMIAHKAPTPDTHEFHQNLYEELIIQQDFGRNPYAPGEYPQNPRLFPGRKLTITCYEEDPGKGAIDACSRTSCSN